MSKIAALFVESILQKFSQSILRKFFNIIIVIRVFNKRKSFANTFVVDNQKVFVVKKSFANVFIVIFDVDYNKNVDIDYKFRD